MTNDIEPEIVELYERYVEGVYCFCLCRLKLRDLAEEAVSDVFLKFVGKYPLLKIYGQKKKTDTNARKWLYGEAKNAISRQIRQANRQKTNMMDVTKACASPVERQHGFERQVEYDTLRKALGKLKTLDQEIVIRRFWKNSPTAEIAKMMGMEHGTVRVRLSRSIRALRKNMGMRYV